MVNKIRTKKELAQMYGVHYNTFAKWINAISDLKLMPKQRLLTPKQVAIIVNELGEP
jgi:transposase